MQIEPMSVPDAWVCSPQVFADDRGTFLEWFRADALAAVAGRPFTVAQANHSISRRGVVRGLHFADLPPGQAKFVYCPAGAVLDVIVDVRVGSPTFGAIDSAVLDADSRRGVFISEGLGHAFCALADDSAVTYLVSSPYNPTAERTVSPTDPALAWPWPTDVGELILSDKDVNGPTLAEAAEQGVLPTWAACQAWYAGLATVD
jgi:dTDP-4-dehydrorhamnose 3,5-epimerase